MRSRNIIEGLLLIVAFVFVTCSGGCNNTNPVQTKSLTAYFFVSPAATGNIDELAKTISVTVPYGTNVTALVAIFQTIGTSVKVGSTVQVSGTTPNDFTNPVQYTVIAADGSSAIYTVTVTIASSSDKALTAYSFVNPAATGNIDESAKTISVAVPPGTNITALVATYQSTGTAVHVGSILQTSGTTANDFTTPVKYQITAADGSSVTYTVIVNILENWKIVSSVSFGSEHVDKVAFSNKKAYVAYGFEGIQILDISDPSKPVSVGSIYEQLVGQTEFNMYNIAVSNNIACVAVFPNCIGWCIYMPYSGSIRFYNVENPASPIYLSSVDGLGINDIYVDGQYLYATGIEATYTNQLFVIDISAPDKPFIKSSVSLPYANRIAKHGDFIYITSNNIYNYAADLMIVVNVADPANPTVISPSDTSSFFKITPTQLALFNNFAYAGDGNYGLDIIDITSGSTPTITKTIPLAPVTDVAATDSGFLLVTYGTNTTEVYDLQTPQNPTFFRDLTTKTGGLMVFAADGVGVIVSDEVRQYGDAGYSIIEYEKLNFFFTGSN